MIRYHDTPGSCQTFPGHVGKDGRTCTVSAVDLHSTSFFIATMCIKFPRKWLLSVWDIACLNSFAFSQSVIFPDLISPDILQDT